MLRAAGKECGRLIAAGAPRLKGRGYAGHGHGHDHAPKVDTSLDHVFGDNSYRLPFDVSVDIKLWVLLLLGCSL